jgi:phosphatidate cytidylyltransferase
MSEALLMTSLQRFTVALGGGLGLIVVAERHRLRELTKRTLWLRWRTWALSAPLFAGAVMGLEAIAVIFVMVLSLQAAREFAAISHLPRRYRAVLYGACVASAPLVLASRLLWLALPTTVFLSTTLLGILAQDAESGQTRVADTALGFTWIPWMLSFFLLLRTVPNGRPLLLAVGMSVALSDVCAFALGKLFGRHALAPRLSPAKTWEGAAGNLLGAYLGFGLMWSASPSGLWSTMFAVLPAVVAAGCLWGDLFESLVKRHCGVKDAGSWLPGFGGLLDRIDSLLVVLPLTYAATAVLS